MKRFAPLMAMTIGCTLAMPLSAVEEPASRPRAGDVAADPTMAELSRLVGGSWSNDDPKFTIENRYEWAFDHAAIRGLGVIGKGSPGESQGEAIMGWDPVGKSVFYVDCHGGKSIFQGTVKKQSDELVFEFATLVGKPGKWREVARFTDQDTLQFTLYSENEGKWTPVVKQTLKRKQAEKSADKLVTEGVIDAPVDEVWAALCTKEGLESWNVAHAAVDLKVGGKMRTHYDPKGALGDPNTIENVILSFEPQRMLSIKVGHCPESFPFKSAIKTVWQVLHFEPIGPTRTRLQIIGLGYGSDDESRKLRDFFEKGNAYTIKKLQDKLASQGTKAISKG
jgi:uncharacterized protein YndB with AHSA1/START domain